MLNTLYERFGNSIILLCHEPEDEFCHRRLVVDFIEFNTGIYAPELSVDENGYIRKLLPIRYKNRLRRIMNHDINSKSNQKVWYDYCSVRCEFYSEIW